MILQARGIDSMSLAVGASVLGVGIGFGLQRIANDFVSGLIIGLERPIAPGDYVQVGGLSGTVDRIGARGTRLVTRDRVTILVPNSCFLEAEVINWSHGDPVHQLHIQVSVAYGSPLARVRGALLEAASRHPRVLADPGPRVEMVRFGDDALELVLLVFSNEPGDQHELRSDLLFRIDSVFRRHGIQVPYPQRDVRLAAPRLEGLLLAWARRHLPAEDLAALEVETGTVEEETGGTGSWTDVDVDRLGERLRAPGGIPILDRRHRFRTYARCFLGKEAVDWIAREERVSRAEAVALGRLLVARGVVHHVLDEHDFEDEPYFYRYFVDEEGQERDAS